MQTIAKTNNTINAFGAGAGGWGGGTCWTPNQSQVKSLRDHRQIKHKEIYKLMIELQQRKKLSWEKYRGGKVVHNPGEFAHALTQHWNTVSVPGRKTKEQCLELSSVCATPLILRLWRRHCPTATSCAAGCRKKKALAHGHTVRETSNTQVLSVSFTGSAKSPLRCCCKKKWFHSAQYTNNFELPPGINYLSIDPVIKKYHTPTGEGQPDHLPIQPSTPPCHRAGPAPSTCTDDVLEGVSFFRPL